MAESGLTLALADFRLAVSEFLYGGDGTYSSNTVGEQARIDRTISEGLRQFYQPPPINGRVHEWSFLCPASTLTINAPYSTGTLTIVSGVCTLASGTWPSWAASGQLLIAGIDYSVNTRDSDTQVTLDDLTLSSAAGTTYSLHEDDYTLPDDFAEFVGPITYRPQDNTHVRVMLVGEGRIRQLRQYPGNFVSTPQPYMAAIRPVIHDPTVGSRNELMFFPKVSTAGIILYRYRVRPTVLSGTNIYPYGASDHSSTILASIMAVAEQVDDQQRGTYWDRYQQCLVASIQLDDQRNHAIDLGYCGDDSDEQFRYSANHWNAIDPAGVVHHTL